MPNYLRIQNVFVGVLIVLSVLPLPAKKVMAVAVGGAMVVEAGAADPPRRFGTPMPYGEPGSRPPRVPRWIAGTTYNKW